MELTDEFVVAAEHPALPGHFPGDPVVPGVVILQRVAQVLAQAQPALRISGFPAVKFLQPLLPGQRCAVELSAEKPARWRFECRRDGEVIATGQLSVAERS